MMTLKATQSALDHAPLAVGSYRKQMPTQKSSENVLKAMPLKDKRGVRTGDGEKTV